MVSAVGQVRCSPSFAVPRAENVRKGKPNILERIVRTAEEKRVDWTTKAVRSLTKAELKLDKHFPGLPLQQKIDDLGLRLEKLFAPLRNANAWLDSNGEGKWYRQLAVFLAKLPLRVARNVLHLLYEIVKGAVFFAVHPVKSVLRLAKLS
jgi:hypothetical protein